ncbi:MAG: hypothetical protein V4736_16435 [Bdellovibrionota bacterium]
MSSLSLYSLVVLLVFSSASFGAGKTCNNALKPKKGSSSTNTGSTFNGEIQNGGDELNGGQSSRSRRNRQNTEINQDLLRPDVEQIQQELSNLERSDIDVAVEYHRTIENQLKLGNQLDLLRRLSGDSLDSLQYKRLNKEQILQDRLRNGYLPQSFNDYRAIFRKMEWTYFKLMTNLGKLADGRSTPEEVAKMEKQNENYFKYYAENFYEYKRIREYLDAIVIMDPSANSTPAQKLAAKKILRNFTKEVEEKENIVETAKELRDGLQLQKMANGLPNSGIPVNLFGLRSMQSFFNLHSRNMETYLKHRRNVQGLVLLKTAAADRTVRLFFAGIVSKFPPNSPVRKFLQFWFQYNESATMRERYLNDVNEVLDSTGAVSDKVKKIFDKSGTYDRTDSKWVVRTVITYNKLRDILVRNVQLVEVKNTALGKKEIVRQNTDTELIGPPRDIHQKQIDIVKAEATVENMHEFSKTDSPVVTNEFLVYMYRLTHTEGAWVEAKKHLYAQKTELAGYADEGKVAGRIKEMEDAEKVGNQLGELTIVDGRPVSFATIAVGASVLGTPIFTNRHVQSALTEHLPNLLKTLGWGG